MHDVLQGFLLGNTKKYFYSYIIKWTRDKTRNRKPTTCVQNDNFKYPNACLKAFKTSFPNYFLVFWEVFVGYLSIFMHFDIN
jgi:hypothetical protein